jgi:hypothetical protein
MSQGFIIVKSDNRDKSTYKDPANYRVVGDFSLNVADVSTLEATEFSMYYNIPNVNSRNNVFLVDDGSASYPATVAEGYYTGASLAAALQVQLAPFLAALSITYNTVKQRFSIVTSTPFTIRQYPLQTRDLAGVMGFQKDLPLATSFTSGVADLVYTRNIYVKSNTLHRTKLTQDSSTQSSLTDILMTVPVYQPGADVSLPQQISFSAYWPKKISVNPSDRITSFDIQLYDDLGEYLYNPDGSTDSWSFTLVIIASK